jgi:hypothetical protein
MNKVTKILTLGAVALLVMAVPSPVHAACPNPQPMQHAFGSFFTGCPDSQPVVGYAYALGAEATTNTNTTVQADGTLDFVCEATGVQNDQFVDCQPEAGAAGDGNVTVLFDWGGPQQSATGCPNPAGAQGTGARVVIQVVANDGSSIVTSFGFSNDFGQYMVEEAQGFDGAAAIPLACSQSNGLSLVSNTNGLTANTVCVQQAGAPVHTDCDAGTVGEALGTCTGTVGTQVTAGPGNLYSITGPCNTTPDLRRSTWGSPLAVTAGPGGSKCVQVNRPADATCAFVGSSSLIGDGSVAPAESGGLTGWLRIGGAAAASDKVAIKKAELAAGKLAVAFGTENESLIVGFNVYGGSTKLNSGLIAAKGTGSNSYSFEVGRGALKNERSITVEAVKSDGTSVRSASVSVK